MAAPLPPGWPPREANASVRESTPTEGNDEHPKCSPCNRYRILITPMFGMVLGIIGINYAPYVQAMKERLETGLIKLRSSAAQVADMQVQLKEESVVVEQKKAETDELLVQVGKESAVADESVRGSTL